MFCNTCGSKLKKGDKMCTSCGAPADQGEACGGFWGLVGTAAPAPTPVAPARPAPAAAKAPVPVKTSAPVKVPEKKTLPMVFWYGLVAVLAILLLIQTIRVGALGNDLKIQESLAKTYHNMYSEANQENQLLKEQMEGVQGNFETLWDEVTQIKDILTSTEETDASEATEAPEATEAAEVPEATEVPEETQQPEATEAPEENN